MKELPKGGVIGKAVNAVRAISELHIPLYAANACYFIILSLFPALVLILSILRYTGLQVNGLIEIVDSVVPDALMAQVGRLVMNAYQNSSGALVGLSALTAIWSASRGVFGVLTGLNVIYGVSENRGYLYTRFISVVYTFVLFAVLLLTLVLHVFGTTLLNMMPVVESRVLDFLAGIIDFRFFLLLAVQTLCFALIFTFLPNGRNRFRDTIPGALLASIGWLVFSDVFSIYVENFAGLGSVYGSVYSVALAMLWLYCCMSIVFYGGALNQYLEDTKV